MHPTTTPDHQRVGDRLAEITLIVLLLFVVGSGVPPAVNEAHYLGKAKHFWMPGWCSRDLFLQSADAHWSFNWVYGWVTLFVSLPISAWIGRAVGWMLLAFAFHRLSWSIVPRRGYSVLAAALWITLIDRFQMSGEWIVDGVEAKVLAYPLVLFGLTELIRGKWPRVWLWFGAASALHVLVGGWAVIMATVSWLMQPSDDRPRLVSMWPGLVCGGVLALPGLIPAVQLSLGVSPEVRDRAQQIYVFQRLAHHLQLRAFHPLFIMRHLLLIAVFFLLTWNLRRCLPFRRLWGFCCGAIVLALLGAMFDGLLGESRSGAAVLRFYWFRPSDVFVPLGCSIAIAKGLSLRATTRPRQAAWLLIAIIVATSMSVFLQVWRFHRSTVPAADLQGGIRNLRQLQPWRDVCQWCDENLPRDALVLAPLDHQTFRWYANRSELVNWKDVPQDAQGLVQWQRRRDQSAEFYRALEANDRSQALRLLNSLAAEYPISYLITRPPIDLRSERLMPVYGNQSYVIYRIATRRADDRRGPAIE